MKIVIIGLGSIGKKHVKSIQAILPHAEIIALRSGRESESITGVNDIYTFDEIAFEKIEFAIISNPTSEHLKTISKLIKYNFPFFIEKPLHSNLDVENIIDTINHKGIITYVACNLRFLDCIKYIKSKIPQLQNKKLNEVNVYCGSYLPEWRSNADFRKAYSANADLGGGVHIDLIHEIDYLYWFFGKPVSACRYFGNQSSLSISAFDYANYLLEYDGFCANVILNYYRKDPKRSLELVFENETWEVDLLKNQVICGNEILFSSEQTISDTYFSQMQYYIHCISVKENTFNTVNNALDVLKICLGNDTKG